jgi:hypothetical protein
MEAINIKAGGVAHAGVAGRYVLLTAKNRAGSAFACALELTASEAEALAEALAHAAKVARRTGAAT